MKSKMSLFFAGLVLAIPMSSLEADVIWDGVPNDIVPNGRQDVTQVTTFSTTGGFQSPAQGADYYPASANGGDEDPDFFAAKDNVALQAAGFAIWDGGNADLLARVQALGSTSANNISSMWAWQAEAGDFETIGNTGFADFGGNVTNAGYRFIFQDSAGDWFATATEFTNGTSIADVTAESWLSFTPHNAGVAVVGGAATPGSFTDVQHVGFYQEFDTTGGGGVFSTGFSATFTAVPEPAGATLCLIFGIAAFSRRRRSY